jgi:hypothetical protein
MDALKKIQPAWFAVAVLVVIVLALLFRQRRSGFTPSAGAPITMMDLQEFSAFTPEQKTMYIQMITDSSQQLTQAAASKSFDSFISTISSIMRQVIQMAPPQMPAPNNMAPPQMPAPNNMAPPPQMPMAPPPQMPMAPPPQMPMAPPPQTM